MKQNDTEQQVRSEQTDDKLDGGDIIVRGGFLGWLDNFWFYHKWKVIIAVCAAILVVISTLQMCDNSKADITLFYAGSAYLATEDNFSEMLDALEAVMPKDFNGDGAKTADIAAKNIYSPEQVEARKEAFANGEDVLEVNTYINTQEYNGFSMLMQTGEYSVCLLEKWLFEALPGDVFCKISDVLGKAPEGAESEYYVMFWDTDFAKANAEIFECIPKDTVLCLRQPNSVGGAGSEAKYAYAKEMFMAILNY